MNERHAGRKRKISHDGDYHKVTKTTDAKISDVQKGISDLQISPPRHLDKFGKEIWKVVAPELVKLGKVKQMDRVSLELFCTEYSNYRKAEETLNEYGDYLFNENDQPFKRSPALTTISSSVRNLKSLSADLGLSFDSRSGQVLVEQPAKNEEEPYNPLKVVNFHA